jgi:hypothetical protein
MTNKTVKIWGGWGFKTTIVLTIDDDGFGVLDGNARRAFTCGQCHALAIALHRLTGLTIKGLGNPHDGQDEPNSPAHCVVWSPKLQAYVDIDGITGRFGWSCNRWRVLNRHLSEKTAEHMKHYLQPNISAALPFARTIIRDLGL